MADMATHYGWWILAVVLGITELFVGSFYLLVIAVALALAGLSAWLGATFSIQLLVAAVASALGAGLVRYLRPIAPSQQAPERNPDLNLDIGQTVTVEGWEDNGQTRINYRGTIWQAELLSGYPRRIGTHRIHAARPPCCTSCIETADRRNCMIADQHILHHLCIRNHR